MKKRISDICILSGLIIPDGKYSREHYLAKSLCPKEIAALRENIFPSIKIFNEIKGNLYPCEWMDMKYDLCYHALVKWNITKSDRNLIRLGLSKGLPEFDACRYCLAVRYKELCKNSVEKR